jgi:hypothetical protein
MKTNLYELHFNNYILAFSHVDVILNYLDTRTLFHLIGKDR